MWFELGITLFVVGLGVAMCAVAILLVLEIFK